MALPLTSIYEMMVRQFSTSASANKFTADFTDAVNNTLDDIWETGALDTQPTHVTENKSAIPELGAQHRSAFCKGLIYHLITLGQKHSGIEADIAWLRWEEGKAAIMTIERRAEQADVDDDGEPTGDIVGLGYLGS